jgi:SNF2 family DNA or RNA helicase
LSATDAVVQLGNTRAMELRKVVNRYVLRRDKSILDGLLGKEEIIVYCELTQLQQQASTQRTI